MSDAIWCVSCQRWERNESTHYDAQPKLRECFIGNGLKIHIGKEYREKTPYIALALCGSGPVFFDGSEHELVETVYDGLCKNCVREWRGRAVYTDFP